jgi:signal transduction histidine kinase
LTTRDNDLFSNAVDALPPDKIIHIEAGISSPGSKALEAAALESESYSEMKIRNHGSVIKDMDLQRIFSLFFTAKDYGTGIGLTVSKKIVEAHNGPISVHSDDNGTTFVVWLPLKQQKAGVERLA